MPTVNENKENLLIRTSKQQHYHRDNQSGGFNYSSSAASPSKKVPVPPRTSSPITYDKSLPTLRSTVDQTSKIHVDVSHNPSDKLLHVYDSSEPSPRDLTDTTLSILPPHRVNILISLEKKEQKQFFRWKILRQDS